MRKYSVVQIVGCVLSFFLPPIAVWFTEGFGVDFWINCILSLLGLIPGSIHATYIWILWVERKWQTHHGKTVTNHPFLIFSPEFAERSRWKGNGQDGCFGYFDDNIKGGHGPNAVGGDVDPEKAKPIISTGSGPNTASRDGDLEQAQTQLPERQQQQQQQQQQQLQLQQQQQQQQIQQQLQQQQQQTATTAAAV